MSEKRLRDAAKVLRERAEAATPGPWVARDGNVEHYFHDLGEFGAVATGLDGETIFIATMHPGVVLALADWLDVATAGYLSTRLDWSPEPAALAVADLILGAGQ